jgi:hypothetical protein
VNKKYKLVKAGTINNISKKKGISFFNLLVFLRRSQYMSGKKSKE